MVLIAELTCQFLQIKHKLVCDLLRYIILSLKEASYEGQNSTVTLNSKFYSTYKYLKTTINRLKRVSINRPQTHVFLLPEICLKWRF